MAAGPSGLPASEDSNALLRRVGLAVLGSNADFEEKTRHEASNAERALSEMRQKAVFQAAQCRGKLDELAKEARAEEERRLISERVGKELEAFRAEMARKEAQDEERIRQLYRSMIPTESHGEANGSREYPTIFSAVEVLQDAPCANGGEGLHRKSSSEEDCLLSTNFFRNLSSRKDSSMSDHRSIDFGQSRSRWYAQHDDRQRQYKKSFDNSLHVPSRHSQVQPQRGVKPSEAQTLLKKNQLRLERLERLGL
jgi:hypothetical protein